MNDDDRFLEAERRAIEIAKWEKGVEIHSDPGDAFVEEWIKKFATHFREKWPHSQCKDCKKDCAYECKAFCEDFEWSE
jgi:hypothetical protein